MLLVELAPLWGIVCVLQGGMGSQGTVSLKPGDSGCNFQFDYISNLSFV